MSSGVVSLLAMVEEGQDRADHQQTEQVSEHQVNTPRRPATRMNTSSAAPKLPPADSCPAPCARALYASCEVCPTVYVITASAAATESFQISIVPPQGRRSSPYRQPRWDHTRPALRAGGPPARPGRYSSARTSSRLPPPATTRRFDGRLASLHQVRPGLRVSLRYAVLVEQRNDADGQPVDAGESVVLHP